MEFTAITYVGRKTGFSAKIGKRKYEFEWQKSLGIGRQKDEVDPDHAVILSRWKDKNSKRIFVIE
jgi:hypothetical protein